MNIKNNAIQATTQVTIKKWYKNMLDFFWDKRKEIHELSKKEIFGYEGCYYGLPAKVKNKLTKQHIDWIEDYSSILFNFDFFKNKKQFVRQF